ncbi:MAG: DMT family transporter [Actinobacteria bacterium]|nr:DMT family transporter [Actinomycetota bacterium]NDA40105.1 DMT family transporter [Actinomycetota bacterium]
MWGISFVWMKDILDQQDVFSFLVSRFIVAALVMLVANPKVIARLNRTLLLKGSLIGTALGLGYIFQTLGLERTTPAITGFITGLYVVLTPLIGALILKEKLTISAWFYIALATVGLGVLSINGLSIGTGELFVLISAFLFAAHILLLSRWSRDFDAYTLTFVQLATCAIVSGIPASLNGFIAPPDTQVWAVVIFTAVFATFFAFVVQTWAQARISATKVAVILTMEVVFAALFSVALGAEPLTLRIVLGGSMVLVAMVMIVQPKVTPTKNDS